MAHTPEDSAVKLSRAQEAHVNTLASAEAIKTYLAQVAVDNGLVTRDIYSPDVLLEVDGATNPQKYAKSINVNGRKHILEADSELALAEAEAAFYRAAIANPTTAAQPTTAKVASEQTRDTAGRFTAAQDAEAK